MSLRVIDAKLAAAGPNHGKRVNSTATFPPYCGTKRDRKRAFAAVSSAFYTRGVYPILSAILTLKRINGPSRCIQGQPAQLRRNHGKVATPAPHCGANRADRHENS